MINRFVAICVLLFITSLCRCGDVVPAVYNFNYQAKLTDANGIALSGDHTLYFSIYLGGSAASGGTLLYSEAAQVSITDGIVNYSIGSGPPLVGAITPGLFNNSNRYYLQVAVDTESNIILPRAEIQSVPKALRADLATNAQIAPWSGLTGIPSDIADGIPVANVVPVAKSGTPFTTIQSAIDSITDASQNNQYLVLIAPGTYNESVTMKPYVHLEGSGQKSTTIAFTNDGLDTAVLNVAAFCEVRDLTVHATVAIHGFNYAIRFSSVPELRFRNVKAIATDGMYAFAFHGTGSSVELINCSAVSQTSGSARPLVFQNCGSVRLDRVQAEGTGNASHGLTLHTCLTAVVRDSTIRAASTGSNNALGLNLNTSSVSFYNSELTATGPAAVLGMYSTNSVAYLTNCEVTGGSTNAAELSTDALTRFVACKISGGPVLTSGGLTSCTNCLDENYAPSTYPACP